jgi:hypothetical protein
MKIFKKTFAALLIWLLLVTPAGAAGLTPNILNEDFNDVTSWSNGDHGVAVSEISPAGQLRLDTNTGAAGDAYTFRYKTIATPPNTHTIEIMMYCDSIGTFANNDYLFFTYTTSTWSMIMGFTSDGLFIFSGAAWVEVGVDLVKTGGSAVWQKWRFQVNKTVEASATVEVFLNDVSQGTFDCHYLVVGTNGYIAIEQLGFTTNDMVTHIDYMRIATGLGAINDTSNPIINIF